MLFASVPKKLFIASLFLILPYSAFAQGSTAGCCLTSSALKDGFYLGLQGGYDSYRVKYVDNTGGDRIHATMNSTGWVGGALAGYGKDFNCFHLGGEVFVNDSSATNDNTFSNPEGIRGSVKLSVNQSYGIAILPGFKFSPSTLGYVRLGYNWAKLNAFELLTLSFGGYNASISPTAHGFAYGVGMETMIPRTCHASVRIEATHTDYSSFMPTNGEVWFTPSDNQFMLALIYHI